MKFDSYLYLQLFLTELSESTVGFPIYKGTDHSLAVELFSPDRSDRRQGTSNECLVEKISFLARGRAIVTYSLEKNSKKCSDWNAFDMASDKTQVHSKRPLIGLKCAGIQLWSDPPDRVDLWLDLNQTMVQTILRSNRFPDPVFEV